MVTIVIPVYNVAEYLPECIDSIIAQSQEDWELILIDDGSSDDSGKICDDYASRDKRIKVAHTPNRGASSARNTGLELAQGEWLTFIDGDDTVDPDYIKSMYEAAIAHGSDLVIAGYELGGKERVPEQADYMLDDNFGFFTMKFDKSLICGKLYRVEMLRECGVRFNPEVARSEDALFVYRVAALHSKKTTTIPVAAYHYRVRKGSAASSWHTLDKEYAGYLSAMSLMEALVSKYGLKIVPYYNPYNFLLRTVLTAYNTEMSKEERLQFLHRLDFDKKWMKAYTTSWKERLMAWLIINKQWKTIDLMQN